MVRVPSRDRQKEKEIARLKQLFEYFDAVPQHRREDECADERQQTVAAMLLILEPPTYPWTTRNDEIAEDAIIVGIGGTSAEMLSAGLTYVEPMAGIYWTARVTERGFYEAGGEMAPRPVPNALARALVLRQRMGYERVVVTLEEVGIWRPVFDRLADREGY